MRYLWLLAALVCYFSAEVADAQISTHGSCNSFTSTWLNPDETADAFVSMNIMDILGGGAMQNAVETITDTYMVPLNMRALYMNVVVNDAPGGTDSWAVSLRVSGSSTNQPTCTITGAATSCTSGSTFGATIAPGAKINFFVDQTDNPAVTSEMIIGVCWGA